MNRDKCAEFFQVYAREFTGMFKEERFGWLRELQKPQFEEQIAFQTLKELGDFHDANPKLDRPKFREFEKAYQVVRDRDRAADIYQPCDYCQDRGRRWIVADGIQGVNERFLQGMPAKDDMRGDPHLATIHCTCARGCAMLAALLKDSRKKPMTDQRRAHILQVYSRPFRDADRMQQQYLDIYLDRTPPPQNPILSKQIEETIANLGVAARGKTEYDHKRKRERDHAEEAYADHHETC